MMCCLLFQSGIPYVEVLCKNRYVGRSFIQPDTRSRQLAVAKKFGALSENLMGQRVVLVDDSIVRGTTVGPIIRLLRQAGAKEVGLILVALFFCMLWDTGPHKSGICKNNFRPMSYIKKYHNNSWKGHTSVSTPLNTITRTDQNKYIQYKVTVQYCPVN